MNRAICWLLGCVLREEEPWGIWVCRRCDWEETAEYGESCERNLWLCARMMRRWRLNR